MLANLKDPFEEEEETKDQGSTLAVMIRVAESTALAHMAKIKDLHDKVTSIKAIEDDEQNRASVSLVADVKKLHKAYDEARKEATEPLRRSATEINGKFQPGLHLLQEAADWLKVLQRNYLRKQEQERRAKQSVIDRHAAEMQEEFNKQSVELGFAPVTVAPLTVPKVEGTVKGKNGATMYTRTYWKFEIENPAEVPREYCEPSAKLIRASVDAGIRNIRGVRIWSEQDPITKTK
jgi:hypothetical protein